MKVQIQSLDPKTAKLPFCGGFTLVFELTVDFMLLVVAAQLCVYVLWQIF